MHQLVLFLVAVARKQGVAVKLAAYRVDLLRFFLAVLFQVKIQAAVVVAVCPGNFAQNVFKYVKLCADFLCRFVKITAHINCRIVECRYNLLLAEPVFQRFVLAFVG